MPSRVPTFPSATDALRFRPRSFARFIGEPVNAALNFACDIASSSCASVRASFPAMNARAVNGDPAANCCENFPFHGQTGRS